jgi:hypothetical protein
MSWRGPPDCGEAGSRPGAIRPGLCLRRRSRWRMSCASAISPDRRAFAESRLSRSARLGRRRARGLAARRKMMLYALTDAGRALLESVVAGAAQARPFDDDRRARADRRPARRPDAEPGVAGGCSQGASTLWLSLALMGAEGVVAITAGILAGSIALLSFGLDSAIEGFRRPPHCAAFHGWLLFSHAAEERAQKLVAIQFFLLVRHSRRRHAERPLRLPRRRPRRPARERPVRPWWLDPAAALLVAAVAVKEGRASWRGEGCCGSC